MMPTILQRMISYEIYEDNICILFEVDHNDILQFTTNKYVFSYTISSGQWHRVHPNTYDVKDKKLIKCLNTYLLKIIETST